MDLHVYRISAPLSFGKNDLQLAWKVIGLRLDYKMCVSEHRSAYDERGNLFVLPARDLLEHNQECKDGWEREELATVDLEQSQNVPLTICLLFSM